MNPFALWRNLRRTWRICPRWVDRWSRLLWLYSDKPLVRLLSKRYRQIAFRYGPPVGIVDLVVRDNRGSDAFVCSEIFDHRYYDFELPFIPETILDLGACTGMAALFFARKYPGARVACVEPMEDNAAVLRKNLTLNHVPAAIFEAAIVVKDGTVVMEKAPLDYGHKIAGIPYGQQFTSSSIEVKAISVPTLLKELGWERIGLLKIDIEGYEAILLRENCSWLARVDALCIECHEQFSEADLAALARTWGLIPVQRFKGVPLLVRETL